VAWVDGGRVHHHLYWPHLPLVWAGIGLLFLLTRRRLSDARRRLSGVFMLGVWTFAVEFAIVALAFWWESLRPVLYPWNWRPALMRCDRARR